MIFGENRKKILQQFPISLSYLNQLGKIFPPVRIYARVKSQRLSAPSPHPPPARLGIFLAFFFPIPFFFPPRPPRPARGSPVSTAPPVGVPPPTGAAPGSHDLPVGAAPRRRDTFIGRVLGHRSPSDGRGSPGRRGRWPSCEHGSLVGARPPAAIAALWPSPPHRP